MLHVIKNEHLCVTVSDYGAELQSILDCNGTEYLWQGNSAYWSGRAPNIFPYIARLTDGCYYLDGEKHCMKKHGIARYRSFECVTKSNTKLVLELKADDETRLEYPRNFSFQIIYELKSNVLEITFRVENQDEKTMYFGMGGHPGFCVPLEESLTFEDYRMRFHTRCNPIRIGFTEDCFLNDEDTPYPLEDEQFISLSHDLFDEDAIVLKDTARAVTLESLKGRNSITLTFPNMTYLGIWHMPKTDAPYVCIEPWSSLPSTKDKISVFEEQKDLLSLEAGRIMENVWTIQIN